MCHKTVDFLAYMYIIMIKYDVYNTARQHFSCRHANLTHTKVHTNKTISTKAFLTKVVQSRFTKNNTNLLISQVTVEIKHSLDNDEETSSRHCKYI